MDSTLQPPTPISPHQFNTIAVVGMGYVGLPLALSFAERGLIVIGIDTDEHKIKQLREGKSYISHIAPERIRDSVQSGRLCPESGFRRVFECDAVIVCVPTPLGDHREPDLSYVLCTAHQIGRFLRHGALVVLESTTYPGTTENEFKTALEESSHLKAGKDFFLAFSPERENPGSPDSDVRRIPKVVGGYTQHCLDAAVALYSRIVDRVVPVSSARVAEAVKITENTFRAVNIAMVNELKQVYDAMGINIWEVIEAAKTKPFGFMPFYPGPGLGGHCIPIDPFYLTWKAREYGQATKLIELAGEINHAMPQYVVDRVFQALNEDGKPVKGSSALVIGAAYKKNVDDDRESPAYVVMELLMKAGMIIRYHDPYIPVIKNNLRHHSKLAGMHSVDLTQDEVFTHDVVVVLTAHDEIDFRMVSANAALIVDARNAMPWMVGDINYFRA